MQSPPPTRAVARLTEENPSYQELVDLYNHLRSTPGENSEHDVVQYALAQVVGEFIDYLDMVGTEFEKSVGLSANQERERILESFTPPAGDSSVTQAAALIQQWRTIERYSHENLINPAKYQESAIHDE